MSSNNDETNEQRRKVLKMIAGGSVMAPMAGCISGDNESDGTNSSTSVGDGGDGGGDGDQQLAMNYLGNSQPSSTDPAAHVDNPTTIWTMNFYDPLVFIDSEDFKPRPWLATDWTTENDGKTWVFDLRDDVTFHSGNQMTADDVVYSMERTLEIGEGLSSLFSDVENTEARDDTTVAFELSKKFGPFIGTLVHLFVVDSEVVKSNEQDGDYGNTWLNQPNVAGTGAWTLPDNGWQESEQWIGHQFEDYWGPRPDEKAFETVRYKYVTEGSVTQQMMRQGDADLNEDLVDPELLGVLRDADNVTVEERPSLTLYHIPFNCQKEPTDDPMVRKALTHAYDYDTAVDDIFQGGSKAAGPVPPTMPGVNEELEPYELNMEKAQAALDESDWTVQEINDIGLEYVWIAGNPVERRTGLLLQNQLSELGLEMSINEMPWPKYVENVANADSTPHLQAVYHGAFYNSPDVFTYLMHHPSAFGSYVSASWYTTDELTSVLEDARQTVDTEARLEKYREAQRLIWEGRPSIYNLHTPFVAPQNNNLGGWTYRAVSNYDKRFADLYRDGDGRAK